MIAWTIWGSERRAALLALTVALAVGAPRAATPRAEPRRPIARNVVGPADLDRHLEKAEKALGRAEGAVRGHDPGRVSLLLKRVDDEAAQFETLSRIQDFAAAVAAARDAARGGNFAAVAEAMNRARALLPGLADYVVLREAEMAVRAALAAAEKGDASEALPAIDRFERAILPAVLLRRLGEAHEAVARARAAMVRRDMPGGAREIAAIRSAFNGLRFAGALSRAVFGLGIGSELMEQGALIAARDQVQHALRDLRTAQELSSGHVPDGLDQAVASTAEVWRRSTRPEKDDPGRLLEARRTVEAIRAGQG